MEYCIIVYYSFNSTTITTATAMELEIELEGKLERKLEMKFEIKCEMKLDQDFMHPQRTNMLSRHTTEIDPLRFAKMQVKTTTNTAPTNLKYATVHAHLPTHLLG